MREDRRLLPGGKNKTNSYPGDQRSLLLLGRSGLGLEDLLDDVSLLDQECTGDPVLDATSTPGTTVCPLNGLLTLGQGGVLAGTKGRDTGESITAVTALGRRSKLLQVVNDQLSTRSLNDAPPVGGGVVWLTLAEGDTLSHSAGRGCRCGTWSVF